VRKDLRVLQVVKAHKDQLVYQVLHQLDRLVLRVLLVLQVQRVQQQQQVHQTSVRWASTLLRHQQEKYELRVTSQHSSQIDD
jgi:hypothetical protein